MDKKNLTRTDAGQNLIFNKINFVFETLHPPVGRSEAAVAPAAAPGEVSRQGDVVRIFLLTFRALCTVRPAPRAPLLRPVRVVPGLGDRVQLRPPQPARLARA